jgi:transposase-like protein
VIVWPSPLDVSTYAARGREIEVPAVRCPACGGPTGPWSGYRRHLRAAGLLVVFIPRVRCRDCGRTDALVPWFVVPYRYDTVDVIGAALELSASGLGVRRIATALGRPETTVREWCRRFGRVAADLTRVVLAAAVERGWTGFRLPSAPRSRAAAAVAASPRSGGEGAGRPGRGGSPPSSPAGPSSRATRARPWQPGRPVL